MGPPAAFLAKLAPGVEVAAGKVRGLGAVAPALIEAGWLTSRREGRIVLVSLTPAGEAERTRILSEPPAAKPPRARAAAKPATARAAPKATPAARLAALEEAMAALTARVAALEGRPAAAANHRAAVVDAPVGAASDDTVAHDHDRAAPAADDPVTATATTAAADPAALRATIIAIVGDLDAGHRLGGLVPIPDVRAELRRRGVTAADADVTAALEELERSWVFDLSIAQAPNAVRDRAAGIERAGRGLLYYVARR